MLFRHPRQKQGLDICPACGRDFVHPVDWMEEDHDHWWMLLRCGACGHCYDAIVCDETAQKFDTKLDRDLARITIDAERLHRQWRKAEVDAFAAALARDLIGADDFAP